MLVGQRHGNLKFYAPFKRALNLLLVRRTRPPIPAPHPTPPVGLEAPFHRLIVGELRIALGYPGYRCSPFLSSSGSRAMLRAIRGASSFVSIVACCAYFVLTRVEVRGSPVRRHSRPACCRRATAA